jgi:hypothetical protein
VSDGTRYEERPFLKLLDCYVLRAIGQLDEAQDQALRTIEPQLAGVYGKEMRWFEVVSDQMEFPDNIDASIRQVWVAAQMKAGELEEQIDPAEFTRQFVDTNFL